MFREQKNPLLLQNCSVTRVKSQLFVSFLSDSHLKSNNAYYNVLE